MFTKMWKKIRGLFISEVRVLRPEVLMNRKQRRAHAAMARKRRRKDASVPGPKG